MTSTVPSGRRMDAVEDLEDRRLARAILAEQRMDLAAEHFETDVVERAHAAECLETPVSRTATGLGGASVSVGCTWTGSLEDRARSDPAADLSRRIAGVEWKAPVYFMLFLILSVAGW